MKPLLPRHEQRPTHRRRSGAFTLLELLSSMAIIVVLMALTRNIIVSDTRRADVSAAIDDFSGVLQVARLEARSKATFVWVCLKPITGPDEGLRVAIFASRDGTSDSSPANLYQAGERRILKRVALKDSGTDTPDRLQGDYETTSVDPTGTTRIGGSTLVLSDGAQNTYSDLIVCFNPRGEAFVPGQSVSGFIEFLFTPLLERGDWNVKSSAILLSHSTGSAQIYR